MPVLSRIPIIGPILFDNSPFVYITLILVIVLHVLLFYTPWGLRTRAVGEHPKAADTLGINVYLMRYVNVIIGGMLAGLGGAYFTLQSVPTFEPLMTNGRGFIALAANIFGKWTLVGSYLASLLFGFADALQIKLQAFQDVIHIPVQFFLMLPYLLTVIVLAGAVGRAAAPAAVGKPYKAKG